MLVNLNRVTASCLNPAHESHAEGCEKPFHRVEAGQ